MLNAVRVGNINAEVEKVLKARFIRASNDNYSNDALDMYAQNEPALKRNEALNGLPGEHYNIEVNYKILGNCKYPLGLIRTAQNPNTGGLAKLLRLKY